MDDCSWVISFNSQAHFQAKATQLLNGVDQAKTEVAWIFASERPRVKIKGQALTWRLRWRNITREFDIKAKPTRWLGFFVSCRMNWQALFVTVY